MKCLCGYEHITEKRGNVTINNGNEPFTLLWVAAAGKDVIEIRSNRKPVELYSCPKCGTVRMERGENI